MEVSSPEIFACKVDDIPRLCGISVAAAYQDIAAGKLRTVKRGRSTLILRADLLAWLNSFEPAKSEAA